MIGKMEEIGRIFVQMGIDVLALNETKLKGVGEVMFGGVLGRKSGVSERDGHARQGVALLVREEWMKYVREWKEVSARIMWVRMRMGCEKWIFVSAYGPGSECSMDEKRIFGKV